MKVFLLTAFALTAFAFNSILCRLALAGGEIDAATFTVVRLVSGAVVLAMLVMAFGKERNLAKRGNWISAFFLFAYAITFSFAYLGLTTGTGALILFGWVQLTMIGVSHLHGARPGTFEWIGSVVAFGGLVYLVFPGLSAPPLVNALLMATAGVAWGGYTLRGKGSEDPLADTAGNFLRSVPMVVLAGIAFLSNMTASSKGVLLGVLSGAMASGVGYSIWYAALKYHTPARAGVLQLAVPVIAAAGGTVFLAESASMRLVIAGLLILGGIALTLVRRGPVIAARPEGISSSE